MAKYDIVAALKQIKEQGQCDCTICEIAWNAALEIERLRSVGDALVACMNSGSDTAWDNAIDQWKEIRNV